MQIKNMPESERPQEKLLYRGASGLSNSELLMTLNLNTKLCIQSKSIISIGNIDSAPMHPREVFGPAIRQGAAAVVLAHNHPSGDPTPSPQDIEVTKRLLEASEVLGIKLLDHVVVGNGCYISMRNEGYFEEWKEQ